MSCVTYQCVVSCFIVIMNRIFTYYMNYILLEGTVYLDQIHKQKVLYLKREGKNLYNKYSMSDFNNSLLFSANLYNKCSVEDNISLMKYFDTASRWNNWEHKIYLSLCRCRCNVHVFIYPGNDTAETWAYQCPENYIQCPGNYCIPLQYVCDGFWHCANGEDEVQCGMAIQIYIDISRSIPYKNVIFLMSSSNIAPFITITLILVIYKWV